MVDPVDLMAGEVVGMTTPDPSVAEYGDKDWSHCPFCGFVQMDGSSWDVYAPGEVSQEIVCLRCDGTWTEIYRADRRYFP